MKLTKEQLKRIIKEELGKVLSENYSVDEVYDYECSELPALEEEVKANMQDGGMKMMVLNAISSRLEACEGESQWVGGEDPENPGFIDTGYRGD